MTDRFSRGVEQLASPKTEIRLGAVYALERIARDSQEDHWTIMEVLTAFARQNAPYATPHPDKHIISEVPHPDIPNAPEARLVTQAIVTVLGRRNVTHEAGDSRYLDLSRADLSNLDFREGDFARVRFTESNLSNSTLHGCNLQRAVFLAANMRVANLQLADLRESTLRNAILVGANMEGADLRNAQLQGANLHAGLLEMANLRGAGLEGSQISETHFAFADLRGAVLGQATSLGTVLGWNEIHDMTLTNVLSVKDPPAGFLSFATDTLGAVAVAADSDWPKQLEANERFRILRADFPFRPSYP